MNPGGLRPPISVRLRMVVGVILALFGVALLPFGMAGALLVGAGAGILAVTVGDAIGERRAARDTGDPDLEPSAD